MGESKHTPRPWQVMNEYDGATIVIANIDGETFADGTSTFSYDFVCDTLPDDADGSRSREIAIANARLIAAAPDLLAFAKRVMADHRAKLPSEARDLYGGGCGCPQCEQAAAAIQKAEGK